MAKQLLPPAILMDLDDTIIDAYARPEEAWARVAAEFAVDLEPHEPKDIARHINAHGRRFWAGVPQEAHPLHMGETRRRIVEGAFREARLFIEGGVDATLAHKIADRFSAIRDAEMKLFPGSVETIDELKARGVKLALITNGTAVEQRAKVVRFGLDHRFNHIQIQGEHGFGKPEERAYLYAMQSLGVGAQDCWMVGDNLEWEVAAPQRLGIHAIWFDRYGVGLPRGSKIVPDRIIHRLSELLS